MYGDDETARHEMEKRAVAAILLGSICDSFVLCCKLVIYEHCRPGCTAECLPAAVGGGGTDSGSVLMDGHLTIRPYVPHTDNTCETFGKTQ